MPSAAAAAQIEDPFTAVVVDEESAAAGGEVTVRALWQVPDGSKAGDTFTLTLPQMLVPGALDGVSRQLTSPDGDVVATYVVSGQDVLFTLTDFAESHVNVTGTAFFGVRLDRSLEPGSDHEVVFSVNGAVYPQKDTIHIVAPGPAQDYSDVATKWQGFVRDGSDPRGRIQWAVIGPKTPQGMAVNEFAQYRLADMVGPGQAILCDEVRVFSGSANVGGTLQDLQYVHTDRYEKTCNESTAEVVITPRANEADRVFVLMGFSRVTDKTLDVYTNEGLASLWGSEPFRVVDNLTISAGGDGDGVTTDPTAEPTGGPTTGPTGGPTTEPTGGPTTEPTNPQEPGPTSEPTGNPTSLPTAEPTTEPTAQPTVQPAPTVTVTAPSTPIVNVTSNPTVVVNVPGSPSAPAQPIVDVTNPQVPAPTVTVTASPVPTVTAPSNGTVDVINPQQPGAQAPVQNPQVPGAQAPVRNPQVPGAQAPVQNPQLPVAQVPVQNPQLPQVQAPANNLQRNQQQNLQQASPARIDTGVPGEGANVPMVAAGGLLVAGSLSAVAIAVRDVQRRRREC